MKKLNTVKVMNEPEAFVYIWYDGNNKMFYIGIHKGDPSGIYAHSSTRMQPFNMNNIPRGFNRRILATGTYENMQNLEIKLLCNRLVPINEKYYNVIIGPPPSKVIKRARANGAEYGRKSKLNDKEVINMREEFHSGVSYRTLMDKYMLSKASVYRIVNIDT